MPLKNPHKFIKYAPHKTQVKSDVDLIIREIMHNAESIQNKKVALTLLADDFFVGEQGDVYADYMSGHVVVPPHNHDYYELNIVLSGKCVEIIGENSIILEDGDILFLPPSVVHASGIVGDSIGINLLLRPNFVSSTEKKLALSDKDNYLSKVTGQKSYTIFRAKDSFCPENAKKLAELFKNKALFFPHHEIYAEALASLILIELCNIEKEEYSFGLPKSTHSADTAEAILGYIRDNISSANLENTARHFGYSPVHLSRLIKKHTGSSFAKFIMLQRMIRAEHLLLKTDMPIGEIAVSTGLESPEYFSRVFKKNNGVSPSQYRKKAK